MPKRHNPMRSETPGETLMRLVVIDQEGARHTLEAQPELSAMEIIRNAGLRIAAQCGGCAACATCHVYVPDHWCGRLPEVSEEEGEMLEFAEEARPNSRLSCQITMREDLDLLELRLAPGTEL